MLFHIIAYFAGFTNEPLGEHAGIDNGFLTASTPGERVGRCVIDVNLMKAAFLSSLQISRSMADQMNSLQFTFTFFISSLSSLGTRMVMKLCLGIKFQPKIRY
jgi:hypothetical protein